MKVYIRAFSLPRKHAVDRLYSYSSELNEHVIKCLIFGKYRPDSVQHWLHEIAAWLQSCDGSNISGTNLKENDYRETLFGDFGTNAEDAKDNLKQFKTGNLYKNHKNNPTSALPYYRLNDTMVENLYSC